MLDEVLVRDSIRIGIEDKMDVPTTVQRHRFGAMLSGAPETQPLEQRAQRGGAGLIDRKLQKRNAGHTGAAGRSNSSIRASTPARSGAGGCSCPIAGSRPFRP